MKKKLLTIVLTAVLLLSVATLGLSTVFRVKSVTLKANLTAHSAVSAEELQAALQAEYERDGTFFVNDKKAKAIVAAKSPYLRVTGFEKSYPSGITITVSEDVEAYAVETAGGYYILSREGILIEKRGSAQREGTLSPNVVVKGVVVSGKVGDTLLGDPAWAPMFALCTSVDDALDGIAKNVTTAEVFMRAPESAFLLTMREGVTIRVMDPEELTSEKGVVAVAAYNALTDVERTTGYIHVSTDGSGKAVASYHKN